MDPTSQALYLRRLEQLREGKRPDRVSLERQRPDGKVDVWFAAAGSFREQPGGRWTYVDELGREWGEPDRAEAVAAHGRLPYGHLVLAPAEATRRREGRAQISFMRPALQEPAVDDRNDRRTLPGGVADGSRRGRTQPRRRRER
jgi:hypothetical protein